MKTDDQTVRIQTTANILQRPASAWLKGVLAALSVALPLSIFALGPPPVNLRSTHGFTILSGAGVTTTGGGTIGGDVGSSPITGAEIHVTDAQVDGTIYSVNAAGPAGSVIDPDFLNTAKGDLTQAYNFARDLTPIPSGPFLNPGDGNIGGLVLVPGLYKFTATASITGADVTLAGGPDDVWVFQIASDLQVGTGIEVILAGGALPKNIFWQVGSSAVLGTFSVFNGTILADQSITMNTSSVINGRALAFEGSVVYNGDSGNVPEDIFPIFIDEEMDEWIPSGQDSGPENPFDINSPDDVDTTKSAGVVQSIVKTSPANGGRQKIAGWYHNNIFSADLVGPDEWIRGKFYIYTNRPFTDNLNTVSNFRIRLQNEGAVLGGMNYEYAQTGGGAFYEPIYAMVNNSNLEEKSGQYLRPSADALKPSLYRADFDPVDVPALAGTRIWATFESFSFVAPSDCILSLTEFVAGTYDAPLVANGDLVFEYDRTLGAAGGIGGQKSITFAGLNTDANIEAGRRPDLKYPGLDPSDPYSSALVPSGSQTQGALGGILLNTSPTPSNLFGIGIAQVYSELNSPADNPRLQRDNLYHARYYVTSAVPTTSASSNTTIFGQINLRVQTAGSAATAFLFINGPANASNPNDATKEIVSQALPGIGSLNPTTDVALDTPGEDGGWYSVVMNSPWNNDIRQDGNTYGTFENEPGFGINLTSMKDLTFGADVISLPRIVKFGPPPYQAIAIAQENDSNIRISRIEVREYVDINDGGYGY